MNTPVIISWKQLSTMVPWSRTHIGRLEEADAFPKRVRIGQNRVGWVLSEVQDYIEKLIQDR